MKKSVRIGITFVGIIIAIVGIVGMWGETQQPDTIQTQAPDKDQTQPTNEEIVAWADSITTFVDSTGYYPDEVKDRTNDETIQACGILFDDMIEGKEAIDRDYNYCSEFVEYTGREIGTEQEEERLAAWGLEPNTFRDSNGHFPIDAQGMNNQETSRACSIIFNAFLDGEEV